MKINTIDKERYRQRTNIIIGAFLFVLAVSAVSFSTVLIALFGNTQIIEGESTGNFTWNVIGVVIAIAVTLSLFNQAKHHEYFAEIYYVWRLKQLHLRIYKKLPQIESAAMNKNQHAVAILKFYYLTQKQIFELDNNTLTLSSVERELKKIEQRELDWQLSITGKEIDEAWLDDF